MIDSIDLSSLIIWTIAAVTFSAVVIKIMQNVDFGIYISIIFFGFTQFQILNTPAGSLLPSQLFIIITLVSFLLMEAVNKERLDFSSIQLNKAILFFLLISFFSLSKYIFLDTSALTSSMALTHAGRMNPIVRGVTTIANMMLGFTIFYLIIIRLKSREKIEKGIVYWLISGAIVSVIGIYVFIDNTISILPNIPGVLMGGVNGIAPRELDLLNPFGSPLIPRVASVLQEPRHLAIFLSPMVLFLFSLALGKVYLTRRPIQLSITALVTICFILTLSRITYILTFAIIVTLFIQALLRSRRDIIGVLSSSLLIILPIVIISTIILNQILKISFSEFSVMQWTSIASGDKLTYFVDQMTLYRAAWLEFASHPILGGGIGSFYYYAILYGATAKAAVVNNVYLETLAELGILGLIALIYLIVTFFIVLRPSKLAKIPDDRLIVSAFRGGFVILLIGYMTLSAFFYSFVWGFIGLGIAYFRVVSRDQKERTIANRV